MCVCVCVRGGPLQTGTCSRAPPAGPAAPSHDSRWGRGQRSHHLGVKERHGNSGSERWGSGGVGEWRGGGVEVMKGRSKWVEMGVKVCVLKVQRWRENGGQHTCIRTHTCTRTRKHMYINTHTTHTRTHAHVHTHTRTARSSICPMTARLRTSGHVPPSRISSSMQQRQNVWPHLHR